MYLDRCAALISKFALHHANLSTEAICSSAAICRHEHVHFSPVGAECLHYESDKSLVFSELCCTVTCIIAFVAAVRKFPLGLV